MRAQIQTGFQLAEQGAGAALAHAELMYESWGDHAYAILLDIAAGGRVVEDGLAGLQRTDLAEQVLRRHALHHQRGGGAVGENVLALRKQQPFAFRSGLQHHQPPADALG